MDAHNNSPRAQPATPQDRVVVIAGPTAVGKTSLAIDLALRLDGEIVNADSRYLYRGFDIGVAKPTIEERRGVPHHLIDILPPDGEMSLARFQDLAMAAIADISGRGRLPILVGGTPLYMNAIVEGWRIPRVPPNPELRARLERELAERGLEPLVERLRAVDPVAAERSARNPRRVIRALEIFEISGAPMSAQEGKSPPPYRIFELALTMPREALYQVVDARVAEQIAAGLVDEARTLLDAGVAENAAAMSSLGYRQLLPHLRGEQSLAEAIRHIEHDTHRYVRHQMTWLRRNPRLRWFDVSESGWRARAMSEVAAFLDRHSEPQRGIRVLAGSLDLERARIPPSSE
ncbi:MAG TPA: tRNA (adenosine(37)-N6)-dimethylallyltransferase MiaA [Thermomicrobiales bacterium]|nr:tRNA (adenosine(37)-N6)-dimethylallyltransferase MiaA [Thermomicrobiales bacterium]